MPTASSLDPATRVSPDETSGQAERLLPSRASSAAGRREPLGTVGTRARRAVHEFLLVPSLVVLAYAAVGVASIVLDKSPPSWLTGLHQTLAAFISRTAASSLLSGIATSVVTVTSITFSVLLLAVQQTASSMTPAVFDQFLRRRTNQVYLGMFVGLSLFSFLVLSSIGPKSMPAFGATLALGLTVVSFGILIVLIYSTVDQMRPTSVTQVIHDRALQARLNESELLRRTRRKASYAGHVQLTARSEKDGYVTGIDVDAIIAAMADEDDAETVLAVTMGDHVAFGQALATVSAHDTISCKNVVQALPQAFALDRERDLDVDASFGVEQLANIAWTALSSSKQNPQTGREAVDRLRDLGSRWATGDQPSERTDDLLPVVYLDRDLDRVLDALLALLVVCAESQQVESGTHTLAAVVDVLTAIGDDHLQAAEPALVRMLGTVATHPLSRDLERVLNDLVGCLSSSRCERAAAYVRGLLEAMSSVKPPRCAVQDGNG